MFTASMHRRRLQAALGLLWLLDGILQLQPAMWSKSFAANVIAPGASGQPAVIGTPIGWVAHLVGAHPVPCNLGIAAVQVLLGLALLARRPFAVHASLVWALAVWWMGEGFGMIPTGAASPLTGAPGAAVLYALAAAVAAGWISGRAAWVAAWCGSATLWLLPDSQDVHGAIFAALPGQPALLAPSARTLAKWADGHGLTIAVVMAILSVVIGSGVLSHRPSLIVAIGVAAALWLWFAGQAFGGLFTGQATDPNRGPLLVLLAFAARTVTPLTTIHPVGHRKGRLLSPSATGRFRGRVGFVGPGVRVGGDTSRAEAHRAVDGWWGGVGGGRPGQQVRGGSRGPGWGGGRAMVG